MNSKVIERLQFITDGDDPDTHLKQVKEACKGGCKWIQLRAKDFDDLTLLELALSARNITDRFNSKLIINDNVGIALKTGSAGVHLGKNDMSISEARYLAGNDVIIGGTANTFEDILRVSSEGADYIGVGPYRFTLTKKQLSPVLGISGYISIIGKMKKENIHTPLIAIGGIGEDDIKLILKAGFHGVAVCSAIVNADNIALKTKIFTDLIKKQDN